jgi:spore germination protein YaaH
MNKKLSLLLILIILLGFFIFLKFSQRTPQTILQTAPAQQPTPTPQAPVAIESLSIFVPYWSLTDEVNKQNNYNRSVYFAITPTENGVNKDEPGYNNLPKYNQLFSSEQKLLAVRMTDRNLNLSILSDKNKQQKIIAESVDVAKKNSFSGVVLDFELFSLFNAQVPKQIDSFVADFSKASKQNNLYFAMTIYGDVFYRHRPYDVESLSQQVDEVMIMAYDFSKSIGEPGPNFPLSGKEKYGYDLKTMLKDYLKVVPKEKISVVFGMYGYDWTVDQKQRPIKPAQALTDNQIQEKYLNDCHQPDCSVQKDKSSAETEIKSGDHIIWFEDINSVTLKQDYLRSQEISKFAYWAFGYF